ncbi:hypothetical protein ACIGKQ_02710 [Gordonia sp. NPDC062954]|uniref:hypothetical protein n=1 Tax=Gordonia sp. NPDC062954 TaxID=3364003 RepID=UPI0037C8CCBF
MAPIRAVLRPTSMAPFPTDRHGLIHRAAVLAAQFSDDDYRHSLRQKETVSIARGVCVPAATRTPSEWHRLKAIAAAVTSEVTPVVSHQSAATVRGLEMLKPNLRRVHMTTGNPDGGYRTATQHRHVGILDDPHRRGRRHPCHVGRAHRGRRGVHEFHGFRRCARYFRLRDTQRSRW